MTTKNAERKGLRFSAEGGTLVHIDLQPDADKFNPTIVGLAIDEAGKGCGAVVLNIPAIKEGSRCRIQVGRLPPMMAEIKWVRELDPQVLKIGVLYVIGNTMK